MASDKKNDLKVAYLINQYPKVSHTFIRREILELEKLGMPITRIALRGWKDTITTTEDFNERDKTIYILNQNKWKFISNLLSCSFTHPQVFIKTLFKSIKYLRFSSRSVLKHIITLAEACVLIRILQQENINHVHAHFGTNTAELLLICRNLGGPEYSFTVHGPEEFDKPEALLLKSKIHHSKFTVAISSYGRSQLFRWIKSEDWSKIKIIHCAIEKDFYDKNKSYKLPSKHSFICVGRLCEQKGQLLLIKACTKLKMEGFDFTLTLAGDGEMRGEIESLIAEHNLSNHITITGWISSDGVKEEILNNRYFILPSFAEGLPVVIMEAMFLRRPVISTYIAGIPELLTNNNGFLIPSGSVEAIKSIMKQIMSYDDTELLKLTNTAFEDVKVNHDITIEAVKLKMHIEHAMNL